MGTRILVVDDEEAFRYSTTKALKDAGYDVSAVPDHRGALAELSSDRPIDLMVTDVVMPNSVNGFALARMARMKRPDLKVVYVTAYDVPTTEAEGAVLRKPVSQEDMVAEIKRALND
jgi:CheY-like chemotaxis protein